MKNIEKTHNGLMADNIDKEFKGYTMEELRYQRALLLVKKEYLKERALMSAMTLKERLPVMKGKPAFAGLASKGIPGKLIRGLDFADYVMLGFQAIKIGKKVSAFLRKKKK